MSSIPSPSTICGTPTLANSARWKRSSVVIRGVWHATAGLLRGGGRERDRLTRSPRLSTALATQRCRWCRQGHAVDVHAVATGVAHDAVTGRAVVGEGPVAVVLHLEDGRDPLVGVLGDEVARPLEVERAVGVLGEVDDLRSLRVPAHEDPVLTGD